MAADKDRLAALEQRIGHRFRNRALLEQAVTHASFLSGDDARRLSYQRLEFLGDRVLGLVIAAMLYERHPDAPEGQLSRALADLVRKETCAAVSVELDVGPVIRMGKGERKSGLARKTAVLGDTCEAILGALYLDAGFEGVADIVRRLWSERIPVMADTGADPKTHLQEWAHTRALPEPRYVEIGRTGPDHAPVFRVEAVIEGLKPCAGEGRSKRAAERTAAEAMLRREGVIG